MSAAGVDHIDLTGIDLTDLDLFAGGFPHDVFTKLRTAAPVHWHPPTGHTPDGVGFWSLTRWAEIHAAAADAATFSSERAPGRSGGGTLLQDLPHGFAAGVLLNMMDDPRHNRIRRLVTPSVSQKSLAAMEPELRARSRALVEAVAAKGRCDFLVDVAAELPLQAIARLMAIPQDDRHRLLEWADTTLDYEGRDLGDDSPEVAAANAAMAEYGAAICAARRERPGVDDILSRVATAGIDRGDGVIEALSDIELLMFFNLLVAAGSETTRNAIAGGLLALVQNPDQMRLMREDRSVWPTAVEEILRWTSATAYNRRSVTRDVDVGGRTIRAGDKVLLWWASANRDEDVFGDPFRFDLRRSDNPHLTFGHGTHYCLGANLARTEIRVLFEELFAAVDDIELAGPVSWVRSNKHTGIRHMPIRVTPAAGLG